MPACAASACEVATQLRPNIGIRSDGYPVTQSNGFMALFQASAAHALPRPLAYRISGVGEGAAEQDRQRKTRARGPALREYEWLDGPPQ
ncbi:hypothetical protein MRA01_02610 [Methylobacterium radiotolerans]|nr:hypothetical protein MRA01_02610 [Methylobacterium radiotolerans]